MGNYRERLPMKLLTVTVLTAAATLVASPLRAETRLSLNVHFGLPFAHAPARPIFVAPPPLVIRATPPPVVCVPAPGHWREVVVRTWIPERWVLAQDRFGRTVRRFEPGHTVCRTERVWINPRADFRRPEHRDGHRIAAAHGHHAH